MGIIRPPGGLFSGRLEVFCRLAGAKDAEHETSDSLLASLGDWIEV